MNNRSTHEKAEGNTNQPGTNTRAQIGYLGKSANEVRNRTFSLRYCTVLAVEMRFQSNGIRSK